MVMLVLLILDGTTVYADVMEQALYNTVLSGMSLDGKSFFYVNPLEVFPEACHKDVRKAHIKSVRQKWFGCACCPPNLVRAISSVGRYAFTESNDILWIHLYVGAEITVNDCAVKLSSEFPWNGQTKLQICKDMEKEYSFGFRIPGWCEKYDISVDDGVQRIEKAGYLYLTKKWKKGEEIRLYFHMTVTGIVANQMVREDIGRIAVKRGPLVYCMEEIDNGKNLHLLKLKLPLESKEEKVFELGHKFIRINVSGVRNRLRNTNVLYQKYEEETADEVILKYIPYYIWNNRGEGEMQVWTRY